MAVPTHLEDIIMGNSTGMAVWVLFITALCPFHSLTPVGQVVTGIIVCAMGTEIGEPFMYICGVPIDYSSQNHSFWTFICTEPVPRVFGLTGSLFWHQNTV